MNLRTHSRSEPKGNTEGDRLTGKNRTLELWYSFKGPEIQVMGSWTGGEVGKNKSVEVMAKEFPGLKIISLRIQELGQHPRSTSYEKRATPWHILIR